MTLENLKETIFKDLEDNFIDKPLYFKRMVDLVVEATVNETLGWISEVEKPAPKGEYLLVSVNGTIPSGLLCYKNSEGLWVDALGQVIKDQTFVRFYRHVELE